MTYQIVEVNNRKYLNKFIRLPFLLYKNDPHYVPKLKSEVKKLFSPKHPVHETLKMKAWVALKDNVPIGRIAAIVNQAYLDYHQQPVGHFGFFECIQDKHISKDLFALAENFLRDQGMNYVQGPVSPTTNYECGLLIDGIDDAPQIMMSYNPAYYEKLLKDNKYQKAKNLLAFKLDLTKCEIPSFIKKFSKKYQYSYDIRSRPISTKKWDEDMLSLMKIYNEAWEDNWGHLPMNRMEFLRMGKEMKAIVDPDLIQFIEVRKEPIGAIVILPDFYQVLSKIPSGSLFPFGLFKALYYRNKISRARVILMGIKKEYRVLGLSTLLYTKLYEIMKSKPQYKELELSWVLEDNKHMIKPIKMMGGKLYKKYQILQKKLEQ